MSDARSSLPADGSAEPRARLTVNRTSPLDFRYRQVILKLDDQPFATLLYPQSITREIPPGRHELRAWNTLVWKTVTFDVEPGGHATFTVINRTGRLTWWMLGLLGVGPLYLTLERTDSPGS